MTETPAKKGPVVVSVLNLKGGVGKTTIAALLARYALGGRYMRKVLAIDLDPQANLSQALMGGMQYQKFMDSKDPSIVELFEGYIPPSPSASAPTLPEPSCFVQGTGYSNLDIIPSRFDFADNLIKFAQRDEKVLARFISANMQHKDLILIDCAPTESILTRAAYHASRYVLIPVKTELFSTIGFPLMKKSLERFRRENTAHSIDVCGILVNKIETKHAAFQFTADKSLRDIRKMAKEYGWPLIRNRMTYSRGYLRMMMGEYRYLGNARDEVEKWVSDVIRVIGLDGKE